MRGGNASTTDGDRRDQTGRTRLSAVQSLVYKAWRQGGGRCWGEACAHHHHEEHGVGLDGAGPRSGKAEGIRLGLEALRASAHSVAVQSVDHLLDAGPLWRILAHAVQEVVPHGHIAAAGAEAKHQCEERGARNVRGVAGARAGAHQVSFPRRAGPASTDWRPTGSTFVTSKFLNDNERTPMRSQLTSFFPGNTEAPSTTEDSGTGMLQHVYAPSPTPAPEPVRSNTMSGLLWGKDDTVNTSGSQPTAPRLRHSARHALPSLPVRQQQGGRADLPPGACGAPVHRTTLAARAHKHAVLLQTCAAPLSTRLLGVRRTLRATPPSWTPTTTYVSHRPSLGSQTS